MDIRKSLTTLTSDTTKSLLPSLFLKNIILTKFNSLITLISSSTDYKEYAELQAALTQQTAGVIYSLYYMKVRAKTSKHFQALQNTLRLFKTFLEPLTSLSSVTPKETCEENLPLLVKLIGSSADLHSYIDPIVQELEIIEADIKKNYQDSTLSKKIETYKLILRSLGSDVLTFKEGVQFYHDNINSIQTRYRHAGENIEKCADHIETTQKHIAENKETTDAARFVLAASTTQIDKVNALIQSLKKELDLEGTNTLIKQDIETLDQLFRKTGQQVEILSEILEKNDRSMEKVRADFDEYCHQFQQLLTSFTAHSRLIQEKTTELNLSAALKIILQASKDIKLISGSIKELIASMDEVRDTIKADLKTTNQHLVFARELQSKIGRFLNQTESFRNQLEPRKLPAVNASDSPSYLPSLQRSEPSKKKIAHIAPPDEELISPFPFSNKKLSGCMTENQSHEMLLFLRNQVKNQQWKTPCCGIKSELMDDTPKKSGLRKRKKSYAQLSTTHHANQMINIFNTVTIAKIKKQYTPKHDLAAINKIDDVAKNALNKHPFFRAARTEIAYRRIRQDIQEVEKISQLTQPDETFNLIKNKLDTIVHQSYLENTTPNQQGFNRKLQDIVTDDQILPSDKLIQLYLLTKDYFYKDDLTPAEKKYFSKIVLSLTHVNINSTLLCIKNEIEKRCHTNQWAVHLGGELITLEGIQYRVPTHVKEIWDAITDAHLKKQNRKLTSFLQQKDKDHYLMNRLSKIICISEKAAANSHFKRHQDTQNFYMDIANSKLFLQHYHEPSPAQSGKLWQNPN